MKNAEILIGFVPEYAENLIGFVSEYAENLNTYLFRIAVPLSSQSIVLPAAQTQL